MDNGVDLSWYREDHAFKDFHGANLSVQNFRGATFYGANLSGADLRGALLYGADLRRADLRLANLSGADLRGASFYGADLRGAMLYGANLHKANLSGAENIPFIPMVCPEEGSFIGYKKARDYIVKLEILADAKRSSATTRKCRCNKARVISITKLDGSETVVFEIPSSWDSSFIYKIGEIVSVDDFDDDRWNECSTGIHFFINRQEAVDY